MSASNRHIANSSGLLISSLGWVLASGCCAAGLSGFWGDNAIAQEASTEFSSQSSPSDSLPPQSAAPQSAASLTLLVNSSVGDDATADGSDRAPFKTITQALQVAQPNTMILVTSGTYSRDTGETFPLRLKPGVTLQGNAQTRGQGIEIQGGGFFLSPTFARQNVAVLGANQATIVGITIKNPDPQGYGLWVESTSPTVTDSTFTGSGHDGISVTGNSAPMIRNNYFVENGANGITIYGTSRPEVRENIFERTGFAINTNQNSAPLIIGNRITQNKTGVVVQANSKPVLRNNSIEGNEQDGLVAIAQSRPDLGTSTEPGSNSFRNNGQFDVNVKATRQTISAAGNELTKTAGQLDFTGAAIDQTATSPPGQTAPSSAQATADLPMPPVRSTQTASSVSFGAPLSASNAAPRDSQPTPQGAVTPLPANSALANETSTREVSASKISAASFPRPGSNLTPPSVLSFRQAQASQSRRDSTALFPVPAALAKDNQPRALRPLQLVSLTQSTPADPSSLPTLSLRQSAPSAVAAAPASPALLPSRQVSAPILMPIPQLAPTAARQNDRPAQAIQSQAIQTAANTISPAPNLSQFPSATRPIAILVPQPESRSIASPTVKSKPPALTAAKPTETGTLDLLLVPGPNAPIGNVGSGSGVKVYRAAPASSDGLASNRGALGRYRVVVPLEAGQQTQVRALAPNAFQTSLKGRTVLQLGAFSDRAKADQLLQSLMTQGIKATIESSE